MTLRVPAVALTAIALALIAAVCIAQDVRAQESVKTVADGVYTEAQAIRGAASYDAVCSGCHRSDMGGADGPALRQDRFARTFAERDLKTLYTKIASTMPRSAPGSLGDNVYLDIVAHILRENGFPAGTQELNAEGLNGVRILPGRPKPPPPVADFSYVEVVGCLTPGAGNTWMLTNATEPVSVLVTDGAASAPVGVDRGALGTQAFRLLDAMAYSPESHKGQKIYVRGLLIKLPSEQRMTISALETIAPSCSN
jgi:mono/diheme cytochrome c family protein